jgi:Flp pilus assembly pilin Flp
MNQRKMHRSGEHGQGLIENTILLVLVTMVVLAVLLLFGPQVGNAFSLITHGL